MFRVTLPRSKPTLKYEGVELYLHSRVSEAIIGAIELISGEAERWGRAEGLALIAIR